jgi:pullulanase/glycogen debranching enzyme
LTSPGPVMIHQGQEFARARVIAASDTPDPDVGKLDHNSYNKDNATNHLDYALRAMNADLFGYYRGLVGLRKRHPLLCAPRDPRSVEFPSNEALFSVCRFGPAADEGARGTEARKKGGPRATGRSNRYIVLLNAFPDRTVTWTLPAGRWSILADGSAVHPAGIGQRAQVSINVPPTSGIILGTTR